MKHAFLLMAHDNYPMLGKIARTLDHPDNAIYVHIDKKSVFTEDDAETLRSCCKQSAVHFVERYDLTWGGYNQANCELRLLEAAVKDGYDYYHYISGADFLTKPMATFHAFFEEHAGCEFIHFCDDAFTQQQAGRFAQYHFLQEKVARNKKKLLYWVEKASVVVQRKLLRIDRRKKHPEIVYKSGGFWCSLTHDFSRHLLSQEPLIRELFENTVNADEHFLQTIVYNSPFAANLYSAKCGVTGYDACLRSIDWQRIPEGSSSPYTYIVDDYEELVNAPNMFCRKITDQTPEGAALVEKLSQLN